MCYNANILSKTTERVDPEWMKERKKERMGKMALHLVYAYTTMYSSIELFFKKKKTKQKT